VNIESNLKSEVIINDASGWHFDFRCANDKTMSDVCWQHGGKMIEISLEAIRLKTIWSPAFFAIGLSFATLNVVSPCSVPVGESVSSRVQQIKKYLADFETG
jgi:hypothetical protein